MSSSRDGSIDGRTMAGTSVVASSSNRGVIGGQASYFYTPAQNAFNPIKHLGVGVQEELRAFHLTQPDKRLSKALFSQQQTARHSFYDPTTTGSVGNTFKNSPKSLVENE